MGDHPSDADLSLDQIVDCKPISARLLAYL